MIINKANLHYRLKEFENLIEQDEIDLKSLRKFIHSGIPECKKYRPLCWKLLFNYLEPKRNNWESHLQRQRNNYRNLIKEICIPPSCKDIDLSVDHPLSDNVDSSWSTFFKDNESFLLQIDKDVRRLLPDISFFQAPCRYPCDIVVNSDIEIRLHHRVAPSTLSSANVERKGVGIKKVGNNNLLMINLCRTADWDNLTQKLKKYRFKNRLFK